MNRLEAPPLRVLASPLLVRCITHFTDGWPWVVHQFISTRGSWYSIDSVERRAWFPRLGRFFEVAVAENNVEMLERLRQLRRGERFRGRGEVETSDIASCAVYHQHAAALEWIRVALPEELASTWENPTLLRLAMRRADDVRFVQWMYENSPHNDAARLDVMGLLVQAERGGLEILHWVHFHDPGCEFTPAVMDVAAASGWLDIVRFLHEHRAEGCTTYAMDSAASNGHLEVVQFLHEHRSEGCTTRAMDGSVAAGHLDVARFLRDNRSDGCSVDAMTSAARHGMLDRVQFLHVIHPEPFSPDAMDRAAENGHLEVVRFLHEHRSDGCTPAAVDRAAHRGFHRVVKFLLQHRSEGCSSTTLAAVAANGFVETARVLCEYSHQGCLLDAREHVEQHASRGRNTSEVLELLDEFIAPGVSSCTWSQHDPHGHRRCQKLAVQGLR